MVLRLLSFPAIQSKCPGLTSIVFSCSSIKKPWSYVYCLFLLFNQKALVLRLLSFPALQSKSPGLASIVFFCSSIKKPWSYVYCLFLLFNELLLSFIEISMNHFGFLRRRRIVQPGRKRSSVCSNQIFSRL